MASEPIALVHLTREDALKPRWTEGFLQQPLETLQQKAADLKRKHNRMPIIVDRARGSLLDLSRHQYLVGANQTLGFLYSIIRKGWKPEDASKALHFMIIPENGPGVLGTPGMLIGEVVKQHAWKNGFVFITFMEESTFGSA